MVTQIPGRLLQNKYNISNTYIYLNSEILKSKYKFGWPSRSIGIVITDNVVQITIRNITFNKNTDTQNNIEHLEKKKCIII